MATTPNTRSATKRHLNVVPDPHTDDAPIVDEIAALHLQRGQGLDDYSAAASELEVCRINREVALVRHHDATYAQMRAVAYLEQADHTAANAARRAAAAGHAPAAIAEQLRVDEQQVRQWIAGSSAPTRTPVAGQRQHPAPVSN
ncbi:hypothetical protein [Mycobacteroides abscessus]|uniref:hypothetical protein n=1 Tax=Mycobacteroides abscessus TaxID=36809 RepID=UPI000940B33E|nr:hypothetical protein [Mycobacteroides abscessus]MDO2987049.1 hypothetical protein [Mycobacteroides abscessus subsp. abscessus]RIS64134.1 hypothetical protein D2E70_25000 [Mycobacteroides abscessus]